MSKPRPAAAGYIFGAALIIVAAAVLAATIVHFIGTLSEFDAGLQRVALPGQQEFSLAEPGVYTVYQESTGGMPSSSANLTWSVRDSDTGEEISVTPVTMNETYNFQNRHGQAIGRFTLDGPTAVEISGSYTAGNSGPGMTLTVSNHLMKTIMSGVFGMLAGIGGSVLLFIGGLAFIIVTIIRRSAWDSAHKNATAAAVVG